MTRHVWILACLCGFGLAVPAMGQFGGFGDVPVEITADGDTRFEGGVAIAEDNVQIHYGNISIYASYAEYDPETRDVLLIGDIRIYAESNLFTGQRALYNLESRQLRALEMKGEVGPLRFRALSVRAPSLREFRVANAEMSTDDSSEPSFRIRSRSVRIYPDNRVVFSNSTLFVGQVPVFWFPYLFAFTDNTGFTIRPGYETNWGYYVLTSYTFPIGDGGNILGTILADYRTELGVGIGFDSTFQFGKNDRSFGQFRSYYANDIDPEDKVGGPGELPEDGDPNRYRVSFQNRLYLADDIYFTADINLLSDQDFLEDYFPFEFRTDPQPDNFLALTKWNEFYTLELWTRFQLNDFQQATERLPELVLDIKRHGIFGSPIYYDGSTSVGYYRRQFEENSIFPDYESARFDTFHQLSYPRTYFGWLSLVPRIGFRGTYYEKTGQTVDALSEQQLAQISNLQLRIEAQQQREVTLQRQIEGAELQLAEATRPAQIRTLTRRIRNLRNSLAAAQAGVSLSEAQLDALENAPGNARVVEYGGQTFRPVFNTGIEGSFKLSKRYEWIQSRMIGLDGVMHTSQPYFNYSYVYNAGLDRGQILQFDRVVPATNLLPIDFPDFVAIDSIDTWSIMRLGVRNRLTTRRGNNNYEWFAVDTFFDVNFNNPYVDNDSGDVSNVQNRLEFRPLPWLSFAMDSQVPITDQGFYDVNTSILFMPWRDLLIQFANRYIDENPFFADSNQYSAYAYLQVNPHWGVSAQGTYEAVDDTLLLQRYLVHRDLSAWILSVGGEVRDNVNGETDYGLLISMTLKDAPQVTLPLAFDQGTGPLGSEE